MNSGALILSIVTSLIAPPTAPVETPAPAQAAPPATGGHANGANGDNAENAAKAQEPKTTPADRKTTPEAQALVTRITARYADAKTYRDKGTGTTIMPGSPDGKFEFRTLFRRGGGMLWSFSSSSVPGGKPDHPYVAWSKDCKEWTTWWKLTGETKKQLTPGLAFGAAAGTSQGLSALVPSLLGIPVIGSADAPADFFTIQFRHPRTAGNEEIAGVPCVILEGIGGLDGSVTMWVDESGAIRKYRSKFSIDPSTFPRRPGISDEEFERLRAMPKFDSVVEFLFEPVFDGEVPDADTRFTPPNGDPS